MVALLELLCPPLTFSDTRQYLLHRGGRPSQAFSVSMMYIDGTHYLKRSTTLASVANSLLYLSIYLFCRQGQESGMSANKSMRYSNNGQNR